MNPFAERRHGTRPTGAVVVAATAVTGSAKLDALARQAEYEAYQRRGIEPPPPGLDPCALARWKLPRNKDCRYMRQAWDDKWQPHRHANAIANLDRSLKDQEAWIKANCPEG